MNMKRMLFAAVSAGAMMLASPSLAATELTVQRFFGACDADFGTNTDVTKAVGECGIITSLINKFNADNPDVHVNVSTVEWPGYDQLTAQFASGDAPDIVTIHESALSDYQSKGLLMPLDDLLKSVGVTPDAFTDAAREGATKDGKIYGLPIDSWTMLYHINMDLFKQAGLVNADGTPILPKSPEELLAQAEQFKQKTGKPYFVQNLANETALYTRNLYTYLFQQDSDFFADPKHVKLNTPEAKKVVEMYKAIFDKGYTPRTSTTAARSTHSWPGTVAFSSTAPGLSATTTPSPKPRARRSTRAAMRSTRIRSCLVAPMRNMQTATPGQSRRRTAPLNRPRLSANS